MLSSQKKEKSHKRNLSFSLEEQEDTRDAWIFHQKEDGSVPVLSFSAISTLTQTNSSTIFSGTSSSHRLPAVCSYSPSSPRLKPLPKRRREIMRKEEQSVQNIQEAQKFEENLERRQTVRSLQESCVERLMAEDSGEEGEQQDEDEDEEENQEEEVDEEEVILVSITEGDILTWSLPANAVMVGSVRPGEEGIIEEEESVMEDFKEPVRTEGQGEGSRNALELEENMNLEEDSNEAVTGADGMLEHEDDGHTTPKQQLTDGLHHNSKNKPNIKRPAKAKRGRTKSPEVADVTLSYSSSEESSICSLCGEVEPPPRPGRRRRGGLRWAGCDCGAWFHLPCTGLTRITKTFSCQALVRVCWGS